MEVFVLKKNLGDPLAEYVGTWFKIVFSLGAVLEAGIITGRIPVWQPNYIIKGIGVLFTLGAFWLMAYAPMYRLGWKKLISLLPMARLTAST